MERLGKPLVTIPLKRYRTLLECIFASFRENGPMTDQQLYSTLPHYNRESIRRALGRLPDEVTER